MRRRGIIDEPVGAVNHYMARHESLYLRLGHQRVADHHETIPGLHALAADDLHTATVPAAASTSDHMRVTANPRQHAQDRNHLASQHIGGIEHILINRDTAHIV